MTDRMDRYVRGELTAVEARELAQESVNAPELFEELTYSALAKRALSTRSFPGRKTVRFVWLAAAAAVILAVALYSLKDGRRVASPLRPALASAAMPGQPVLLAKELQPEGAGAPLFRGVEPASRSPLPAGVIGSVEDGVATMNLGSLDGLEKGSELQVFRGAEPVGRVVVTTVFRERARGRIVGGKVGDQVRIAAATHLGALLEQINSGDSEAALVIAKKAAAWAETENVPPDETRRALNCLAVLQMLKGDYEAADAALSQISKMGVANGESLNNLGALAEIRRDRRKAQALYQDALHAFADSQGQERRAVEANLARVKQ